MMFGWSAQECLNMPASQMFALLRAGRKIESAKRDRFLYDLCDVSAIPMASVKYYEVTKSYFAKRLLQDVQPMGREEAISAAPKPLSDEQARDAMVSIFAPMRR